MSNPTMIERVGRAIFDVAPFRSVAGSFDEQSDEYKRLTYVYARAAIEEMREPTDAMLEALYQTASEKGYHPSGGRYCIKAIFDAALAEEQR